MCWTIAGPTSAENDRGVPLLVGQVVLSDGVRPAVWRSWSTDVELNETLCE